MSSSYDNCFYLVDSTAFRSWFSSAMIVLTWGMSLVLAKRPPLTDAPASKYYSDTGSQQQRNHLFGDTRSQGNKRITASPSAEQHHQKNSKRHHQHFPYSCGIVNSSRDSSSSSFTTYTTSSSNREQQQQQHVMPSAFGLLEGTEVKCFSFVKGLSV